MTTIKKTTRYWKNHLIFFLITAAPFVIAFIYVFVTKRISLPLIAGMAVYALCCLVWQQWRGNRFKCPDCGNIIKQPTIIKPKAGDPINFYCERCDIEWETGCTLSSDSD